MTTTSSTVWAISASTWLDTSTVRPSAAMRAQQVAQPADAGRVESVGRLVQHQDLRVTQQRGRKPEALAHAHRVLADAAVGGVGQLDEPQHLLDA